MQFATLALVALIGPALAGPGNKHFSHHRRQKKPCTSTLSSLAGLAGASNSGLYPSVNTNATALAFSSGKIVPLMVTSDVTETRQSTITTTITTGDTAPPASQAVAPAATTMEDQGNTNVAGAAGVVSTSTPIAVAQETGDTKEAGAAGTAQPQMASETQAVQNVINAIGSCTAGTVTVTTNVVVTVTVTDDSGVTDGAFLTMNMAIPGPSNAELPSPIPSAASTSSAGITNPPDSDTMTATDSLSSMAMPFVQATNSSVSQTAAVNATQVSSSTVNASSTIASANTVSTSPGSGTASSHAAPGLKTKRGIIGSQSAQNPLAEQMGAYANISWFGNWYSAPPSSLASDLVFVPQMYGKDSDLDGTWTKNAQHALASGEKYMLSFGEPGTPNPRLQMSPSEAAQLWMDKLEPYAKQGVRIGAPGTLQNTQDFTWLSQFLDACTSCTISFLAMHWFDKAGDAQIPGFKDTVAKATALAKGKPIWLANFQASGTAAQQTDFLTKVVPWLDAQDNIQAYAYAPMDSSSAGGGADNQGFVDGNGHLTDLAKTYALL